ncbi:transcriptional coactivator HFI1/ADA1, partial [Phenoliferia sp. Uapishka_3]
MDTAFANSLPALLPSPANPPKRADLLTLKLRLAALLPPEEGRHYWDTLVAFLTGKINRDELGSVITRVLGVKGEAVQLHNALLLSILYNTTRPALPPSSIRHSGWHKRQRDKDGFKVEDRDPKRRKLKASVMALGKRERAEIKSFSIGRKEMDKERERAAQQTLTASLDSRGGEIGQDGLPISLANAKSPSATLQQDYMRCLQTPLCCESKMLPDLETLRDRMSLLAYENGLGGGADAKVAALGVQAIESHLKAMIASVVSLIRSNRANGIRTSVSAQRGALDSSPFESTDLPTKPEITLTNGQTTIPIDNSKLLAAPDSPLSISDFGSLFEISPHLLVHPHLGAVERLYAIPAPSDSESSGYSSEEDPAAPPASAARGAGKTSLRTISRNGSRSGRSASGRSAPNGIVGPASGREQYLIDPSAVAIPQGHPDVAHPRKASMSLSIASVPAGPTNISDASTTLQGSRRHSNSAASTAQTSPKSLSLRNQLFPELDQETSLVESPLPIPHSPDHETSSDGASDSEDGALVNSTARVKGKGHGIQPKKAGRKLWEVVDSVRLLDGVLS